MRQAFDNSLTTSFDSLSFGNDLPSLIKRLSAYKAKPANPLIKVNVIGFILKVFFLLHPSTAFPIKNDSKLVLHAILNGIANFTSRREL